jgi:hypothetical protein
MSIVIEGRPLYQEEDGGNAAILTLYNGAAGEYRNPFVRIQSYLDDAVGEVGTHEELELLRGKRLRVTIEVLD